MSEGIREQKNPHADNNVLDFKLWLILMKIKSSLFDLENVAAARRSFSTSHGFRIKQRMLLCEPIPWPLWNWTYFSINVIWEAKN